VACFSPILSTPRTLVNAFGQNGMGSQAVELYKRMSPSMRDSITSLCVLNACSHSGLLEEARRIFNEISPKTEKITTAMVCSFPNCLFDELPVVLSSGGLSQSIDSI
jgi:hypothetical protein